MKPEPHTDCACDGVETTFNRMQRVKRRFYALRNGALAAQMRSGGLVYKINFGLNLPQIKDVATEVKRSGCCREEIAELAKELWANVNTRESRLLAPMLFPVEMLDDATALKWLRDAQTTEVADVLCHTLLKKHPTAFKIAETVINDNASSHLQLYSAMRLLMNLLAAGSVASDAAVEMAERVKTGQEPALTRLKTALLDECRNINDDFRNQ